MNMFVYFIGILCKAIFFHQVSENLLGIYLDNYDETPWEALKYLIAGIVYGGHVTDDWDRRLLMTYINDYFHDGVVQSNFYQ
jgi:dynein heavy chain